LGAILGRGAGTSTIRVRVRVRVFGHHKLAGLCVAERRMVAVARATEATRRIAQDRKVVKLARVLPIAAVYASYVLHV